MRSLNSGPGRVARPRHGFFAMGIHRSELWVDGVSDKLGQEWSAIVLPSAAGAQPRMVLPSSYELVIYLCVGLPILAQLLPVDATLSDIEAINS